MITEDQTAVIDFLASPSTHGGASVERVDTHASIVFLAGARAYKLKRAVLFDYLDFSTCERRRTLCEAEVRLNRRTAPTLYRGVVAVTRQADGSYALGGTGTPVDWLVEMNRFPQEALFDRLASAGEPRSRAHVATGSGNRRIPSWLPNTAGSWRQGRDDLGRRGERRRVRGVRASVPGTVGIVPCDGRFPSRTGSTGRVARATSRIRLRAAMSR